MKLEFRDLYLTVNVTNESYITSPHTNTKLKKLEVSALIEDEEQEAIEDNLIYARDHNVIEVDTDNNRARNYEIINFSYNYQEVSNVLNYVIEILEVEELEAEKLKIDDIELTPYAYSEKYDEDRKAILITAKAIVTKKTAALLEEKSYNHYSYYSVTREGINKEPINMRFGRNVWSTHEKEDSLKYEVVLIEDKYDTGDNQVTLTDYPVLQNLQNLTVYQQSYIELLENLFLEKELLTEEEIKQLKKEAKTAEKKNRKYLFQVHDVDEEEL